MKKYVLIFKYFDTYGGGCADREFATLSGVREYLKDNYDPKYKYTLEYVETLDVSSLFPIGD